MFKKIVGLGFSTKGKKAKDAQKYVDELVVGGANEFFTGYNPEYWYSKFGFEVSPNGRFAEHEQITDFETLKTITEAVHSHGLEVFINMNARYYTDETWPFILRMLEEFSSINIDGIICGNISILEQLKDIGYTWKVNISTILAAYNTESISFYLDSYNVNKIILSREVTLREIEKLVTSFPNTQFEVFWEWDFCRYNNGLCFAEHKYWAKDICTVVLNDWIIKKKFRADFKEVILNDNFSEWEKIVALDDNYKDIFEQIDDIFMQIDILWIPENDYILMLEKIVRLSHRRVDLYFDAMQPVTSQNNKNIISYYKAIKTLKNPEYTSLENELSHSIKTGMQQLGESVKNIWIPQLKAQEIQNLYAKGDSLNLYTYLFFSKFPNIETVKFPTRGRNYNEKIKIIEETVKNGEVDEKYLTRNMSIERTHYDLTYLFGEKLWFRDMIKDMK